MNNCMSLQSAVFLLLKDYTMINIITLKINGMKNLPNLTQCQENLYCIYRSQMERSSIHRTKHLFSPFSPLLSISFQNQTIYKTYLQKAACYIDDNHQRNRGQSVNHPSKLHLRQHSWHIYRLFPFMTFPPKELSCS